MDREKLLKAMACELRAQFRNNLPVGVNESPSAEDADFKYEAQQLIDTIESSGYWLAPDEPTEEMLCRGSPYMGELQSRGMEYAQACYHAMRMAASPSNKEREDGSEN